MAFSVERIDRLFKVLGDANRLRILQVLGDGERSVSEILERTGLAQTLTSFHLRTLREAGVLVTERRGPFIYYRLANASLPNLLEAWAKCAESLADTAAAPDFQWPSWAQMCQMMQRRRR